MRHGPHRLGLIPGKDFATLQMQDGPLAPRLHSVALRRLGQSRPSRRGLGGLSLQRLTADDDRDTLVHHKSFTMRTPEGQVGRICRVGRVLQVVA
jgi:hypothetical protein